MAKKLTLADVAAVAFVSLIGCGIVKGVVDNKKIRNNLDEGAYKVSGYRMGEKLPNHLNNATINFDIDKDNKFETIHIYKLNNGERFYRLMTRDDDGHVYVDNPVKYE